MAQDFTLKKKCDSMHVMVINVFVQVASVIQCLNVSYCLFRRFGALAPSHICTFMQMRCAQLLDMFRQVKSSECRKDTGCGTAPSRDAHTNEAEGARVGGVAAINQQELSSALLAQQPPERHLQFVGSA